MLIVISHIFAISIEVSDVPHIEKKIKKIYFIQYFPLPCIKEKIFIYIAINMCTLIYKVNNIHKCVYAHINIFI